MEEANTKNLRIMNKNQILTEPDQNFVNEGKPCEISNEQNPGLPRTIL